MALFSEEIELRQAVADRYAAYLPDILVKPTIEDHNQSVFAQYTIQVENRTEVQNQLKARGIPTAVHYPVGLHQQPILKDMYPEKLSFPVTEKAADQVMSIPMHPYLKAEEQKMIADALEEVLASSKKEVA